VSLGLWLFWKTRQKAAPLVDGAVTAVTTAPPSAEVRISSEPAPKEETLPANAKFRYKERIYWVATRPYSPEEAKAIGNIIRDLYNLVNTQIDKVTANYDGTLVMLTREWKNCI
jgi:hypothetical protein